MRIVMPLFDFYLEGSEEFQFGGGKYSLRRFDADKEMSTIELFSKQDIEYMKKDASWALVAEDEDLKRSEEEVNILLLSFRIYKLARAFIKYRLCKHDVFRCSRLNNIMRLVLPDKANKIITFDDLNIIDKGFSKLLEMITVSYRTKNAIYFMYRGFCTGKMIDSFVFLMCAIESLFSDEKRYGATKTICSRVSKFLDCKSGYGYKDIEELYDLRSKIVHGKVVVEDEIKDKIDTLYKLQSVLVESMKKILDEKIYLTYNNVGDKEAYYDNLTESGV